MIRFVIWDIQNVDSTGCIGALRVCEFARRAGGRSLVIGRGDGDLVARQGLSPYLEEAVLDGRQFAALPDPEMYNYIVGSEQLVRTEVVVVSDREEAIHAAQAAGVYSCQLWTGKRTDALATWTVTNCLELFEMLRWEDMVLDHELLPPEVHGVRIQIGALRRRAESVL